MKQLGKIYLMIYPKLTFPFNDVQIALSYSTSFFCINNTELKRKLGSPVTLEGPGSRLHLAHLPYVFAAEEHFLG